MHLVPPKVGKKWYLSKIETKRSVHYRQSFFLNMFFFENIKDLRFIWQIIFTKQKKTKSKKKKQNQKNGNGNQYF